MGAVVDLFGLKASGGSAWSRQVPASRLVGEASVENAGMDESWIEVCRRPTKKSSLRKSSPSWKLWRLSAIGIAVSRCGLEGKTRLD